MSAAWQLGEAARAASERVPSTQLPYDGAGPWVEPCIPLTTVPEHMLRLIGLMRRQAPWIRRVSPIRACERRADGGLSVHSTGRAADVMVPVVSGPEGEVLANWLVANAKPLGVQLVIWNRGVWQGSLPIARRFSGYTGSNPHIDHVHVELTRTPGPRLDPAQQPPIAPQFMAFVRQVLVPGLAETPGPGNSASPAVTSTSAALPWLAAGAVTALVMQAKGAPAGAAVGALFAAYLVRPGEVRPGSAAPGARPMRY